MILCNKKKLYRSGQEVAFEPCCSTSRYKYVSLRAISEFKIITRESTVEKYEEAMLELN